MIRITPYIAILLCFLSTVFPSGLFAADAGWILLFGSRECDECQMVKEQWQAEFQSGEDPVLVFLEVENNNNYQFLSKIEKQLEVREKAANFPVFLVGNRLLTDVESFFALQDELYTLAANPIEFPELFGLREIIRENNQAVIPWVVQAVAGEVLSAAEPGESIPLLYFLQKGCQNCSRQLRELRLLSSLLPGLQVDCYDIGTEAGQLMLQRAKEQLKIPDSDENLAPMLAWQDGFIAHRLASAEELRQSLRPAAEVDVFWKQPFTTRERQALQESQGRLLQGATLTVIAAAGLIDGINPCAFATSIFLIGYLLYLKRRPRQIILVGVSFCVGVFVSYLLFGLGFSFLIDFLGRLLWVKPLLYLSFGLVALLLGALHLRDAWRFRGSGKSSDMDMGLSQDTHRRIHSQIKKWTQVHSGLLIPAALLLGCVVSSMELACTGQIYLPTLAAINSAGVNMRAFSLLLLYNFFFIVPLLIVTGLASMGIGGKALAAWARKNVFTTKIMMAVLFICLATLMFVFAWRERPSAQVVSVQAVDCLQTRTHGHTD